MVSIVGVVLTLLMDGGMSSDGIYVEATHGVGGVVISGGGSVDVGIDGVVGVGSSGGSGSDDVYHVMSRISH